MSRIWLKIGCVKGYEKELSDIQKWWQVLIGSAVRFDYVLRLNSDRKVEVLLGIKKSDKTLIESLMKSSFKDIYVMNDPLTISPKVGVKWTLDLGDMNEEQACDWPTLVDMMSKFARIGSWVSLRNFGVRRNLKFSCSLRNKRWLKTYLNVVFPKCKFNLSIPSVLDKDAILKGNAMPWIGKATDNLAFLTDRVWFFEKELKTDGSVHLGKVKTNFVSNVQDIMVSQKDRMRHMYILGKTGVGKSTLIYNMFMQDVENGNGCCVVDPHGDLVEKILENYPKRRVNDLVILDPTDETFPFAFNILDSSSDSRDLVVAGVIDVFKKLYGHSWGPRMEYILRNALMVLVEVGGQSLLSLQRFLVEEKFRGQLVKRVQDPVVKKFWVEEFGKLDARAKKEYVAPILNKIGQFMSVGYMRNILGQVKSKVDFFWMMNKQKVILVKLPKGQLGEENATLLGAMILTFLQLQVMRRQSLAVEDRKDFYLYVDEFQNFATSSFEVLLSEARKYGLGLIVANQFMSQLEETTREALLGNVGSLLSFRLGLKDAELISKYLGNGVEVDHLLDMPKFQALVKTLIEGEVVPVFSLFCDKPFELEEGKADIEKVLRAVRDRYTSNKDKVEEKIGRFVGAEEKKEKKEKKDNN